jgi:hypothetical protein
MGPWDENEPPEDGYDPVDPTVPLDPIDVQGRSREQVRAALMAHLPHYGSPEVKPVQFAEVYARLVAVSIARAEFYGAILAEVYDQHRDGYTHADQNDLLPGLGALVGNTYSGDGMGGTIVTGEAITALVALEREERDRAAKLSREGIRMGLEAKQVDVMRTYGRTVVSAMRALCAELGISWGDAGTRRAAQRAVLSARAELGFDVRSPNEIGPALSPEEIRRARGDELRG